VRFITVPSSGGPYQAQDLLVDPPGSIDPTGLALEVAARIAGDNALQAQIDAEVAARIAGDAGLQAQVDAEEAARIAADDALQDQIDSFTLIDGGTPAGTGVGIIDGGNP
jgi:xylose isomerase